MRDLKIIPCPICSREVRLYFLWDIKVYYNGCDRCKNHVFSIDDDVAWVKEYSEKFTHRWWIFRLTRRYWTNVFPRLPFELHLLIKEPDVNRITKITDLVLTLYKKMYVKGFQVPIDIGYYLDEKDKI